MTDTEKQIVRAMLTTAECKVSFVDDELLITNKYGCDETIPATFEALARYLTA